MEFYAIVDRFNEGFYYDFEKEDFVMGLNQKCLLPTKQMATEFIADVLSEDSAVITVTIQQYTKTGSMEYTTDEDSIFNN